MKEMITRNITDAVFEEYEKTANQLFKNLSVKKSNRQKMSKYMT